MTIDISPGLTYINRFPGTETIPCSAYDEYIQCIYLSGGSIIGVLVYVPDDMFSLFTSFEPGSGIYIVNALSSFQIEYN